MCRILIKNFTLDVSLMDDTVWASYSLSLMETMCEQGALANQMTWTLDSSGKPQVPMDILEAINCPNSCSGNGYCNGRHCICSPGMLFYE